MLFSQLPSKNPVCHSLLHMHATFSTHLTLLDLKLSCLWSSIRTGHENSNYVFFSNLLFKISSDENSPHHPFVRMQSFCVLPQRQSPGFTIVRNFMQSYKFLSSAMSFCKTPFPCVEYIFDISNNFEHNPSSCLFI
jgi:hypothetical protein